MSYSFSNSCELSDVFQINFEESNLPLEAPVIIASFPSKIREPTPPILVEMVLI